MLCRRLSSFGRIQFVCLLLCVDPDQGATELLGLIQGWINSARPEDCYALAVVLQELEDTSLVQGRARASTLLVIGWIHGAPPGEIAQLREIAIDALRLAQESHDDEVNIPRQSRGL